MFWASPVPACRLVVLQAAHALDLHGNKAARGQIAAAKALAPSAVLTVIDRAIQVRVTMQFSSTAEG